VKRTFPIMVASLVGFLLLTVNFMPSLKGMEKNALDYFGILAAFALILGAGSLLRTHSDLIRRGNSGWGYSIIVIASFFITLIVGIGKFGVPPVDGIYALIEGGSSDRVAEVWLRDDGQRKLHVRVYGGEPGTTESVRIGEVDVGELTYNEIGQAVLDLKYVPEEGKGAEILAGLMVPPNISPDPNLAVVYDPMAVQIGSDLSGNLERHGSFTGKYLANGAPFWWLYEYVNKPLQQTTFAMLAFYVASAAFRAFRARNAESVLLLLTAFVILMGRTPFGAWITDGIPTTGPLSFFRSDEMTGWIMSVMNTAGNRAIMIGVALGVVATSLRILLGIDRSYLGSDKG
jgi:hypothetical protein